jgi:hypothetical protein
MLRQFGGDGLAVFPSVAAVTETAATFPSQSTNGPAPGGRSALPDDETGRPSSAVTMMREVRS